MAHGYAKIEGKPMLVMAHGTVGLQHAAMAIYNAYADRVPVFVILGNILDVAFRRSDVEWTHAVQDAAAMVRDYIKWDDTPVSLGHFGESAVRAYKIAMTPPYGPVVLVADAALQEEPMSELDRRRLRVPKLSPSYPPAADPGAVTELARMLVAANDPVIIAGRATRTPEGLKRLVELAELLQVPVRNGQFMMRMNFPTRHPLFGGGAVAQADVVLGLESPDLYLQLNTITPVNRMGMQSTRATKADARIATLSSFELLTKSNYQDAGRYNEVDLSIAGDCEATLPTLIDACRRLADTGSPPRHRAAGPAARGGITPTRRPGARGGGVGLGRAADLDRAPVRGDLEPDQATRTGRSCRTRRSSATGRSGSGTSRGTISTSAGRVRTASATARRRLSARRSPIGSRGGSVSTSSATAI